MNQPCFHSDPPQPTRCPPLPYFEPRAAGCWSELVAYRLKAFSKQPVIPDSFPSCRSRSQLSRRGAVNNGMTKDVLCWPALGQLDQRLIDKVMIDHLAVSAVMVIVSPNLTPYLLQDEARQLLSQKKRAGIAATTEAARRRHILAPAAKAHSPVTHGTVKPGASGVKDVISMAADIALGVPSRTAATAAALSPPCERIETKWEGFSASLNQRQRYVLNEMMRAKTEISPSRGGVRRNWAYGGSEETIAVKSGRRRQARQVQVPAYIKGVLASFLENQAPACTSAATLMEGEEQEDQATDGEEDEFQLEGRQQVQVGLEALQTPTVQNDVKMLLEGVARLHQEVRGPPTRAQPSRAVASLRTTRLYPLVGSSCRVGAASDGRWPRWREHRGWWMRRQATAVIAWRPKRTEALRRRVREAARGSTARRQLA
jgi:hypothetical protein